MQRAPRGRAVDPTHELAVLGGDALGVTLASVLTVER